MPFTTCSLWGTAPQSRHLIWARTACMPCSWPSLPSMQAKARQGCNPGLVRLRLLATPPTQVRGTAPRNISYARVSATDPKCPRSAPHLHCNSATLCLLPYATQSYQVRFATPLTCRTMALGPRTIPSPLMQGIRTQNSGTRRDKAEITGCTVGVSPHPVCTRLHTPTPKPPIPLLPSLVH